jgi:hypothetical protein
MRRITKFAGLLAIVTLILAVSPGSAAAQRGRFRGSIVVGGGFRGYPFFPFYGPFYDPLFSPFFGYPWYPYGYWMGRPWYYDDTQRELTGSVRLQVTPKDTEVYADGYYVGLVEDFNGVFKRLRLPAGGHEIVLYHDGYKTVRQTIQLLRDKDFRIRYELAKLAAGQPNETRPSPPPQPPQTAYQPRQPRAGGGRLVPGRPGPPDQGPPNQAPPDRPMPPTAPMPPRAGAAVNAEGFGTLALRIRPAGAEVLIDGEQWRGPEGDDGLVIQVAAGRHHVEIRRQGSRPFSTDIEIRNGQTTPLNVSLPPQDGH